LCDYGFCLQGTAKRAISHFRTKKISSNVAGVKPVHLKPAHIDPDSLNMVQIERCTLVRCQWYKSNTRGVPGLKPRIQQVFGAVQPVPREMRLEMFIGLQIGILNAPHRSLFKRLIWKESRASAILDSILNSDGRYGSHLFWNVL